MISFAQRLKALTQHLVMVPGNEVTGRIPAMGGEQDHLGVAAGRSAARTGQQLSWPRPIHVTRSHDADRLIGDSPLPGPGCRRLPTSFEGRSLRRGRGSLRSSLSQCAAIATDGRISPMSSAVVLGQATEFGASELFSASQSQMHSRVGWCRCHEPFWS